MGNYRSPQGNSIDYNTWRAELSDPANVPKETLLDYLGYEVRVSKRYVGNAQKIFAVSVECSDDVTKYNNYNESYQGNVASENDYQRIIAAIGNDVDIFEETMFSPLGDVVIFFDARYNTHVVNLLTSPEAWTYTTRTDAEAKFNELTGA